MSLSSIFHKAGFIFCLSFSPAMAIPGDTMVITGNVVNLRQGPSTSYPVLMKLRKNQKIIEIQRAEDWVEIDTGRKDISSGWIYARLLKKTVDNQDTDGSEYGATTDPLFGLFKLAFAELNEKLLKQSGKSYFSSVDNPGNRIVRLTASDAWFNTPRPERNAILEEIFLIWCAAVGDGIPVTVEIVDKEGNKLMSKFR